MSQVRDKSVGYAVRKGFKQTDVGWIPDDWEVKRLREISPKQSVGLVINPSTYFTGAGTVPMLVGSNVSENNIDSAKAKRITVESNEALPASRLNAGDLVMVRVGDPGVTAVVPPELHGCNCASMMIVRHCSTFNSHWLCHMMNSSLGRQEVQDVQYGTAQKQFNISDAVNFRYPVPPRAEQDLIAAAITDVDATLDVLSRLIAKKRDLKQAAMQQLLTGQTRLSGFEGEWEVTSLSDVAEVKTGPFGSSLHEKDYVSNGTPIITVEHLGEFGVVHKSLPKVSDFDLQRLNAYRLQLGDIVFSRVGSVDRNALVRDAEVGWLFSGRLLRVRLRRERVFPPFMSYQFHSESFISSVLSVAVGQTMACLNTQILKGIAVSIPAIEEQTSIASVLSDMDAEIEKLETRLEKTRMLKQGMMQELLTGRTRLI